MTSSLLIAKVALTTSTIGMVLLKIASFLVWLVRRRGVRAVPPAGQIDAIIPAYNEESCVAQTVRDLVWNPYVATVVCVNDGSTDRTGEILGELAKAYPERVLAVHQRNEGKASALRTGLQHVTTPYVFLTDADTRIPRDDGLGYMLALMEGDRRVAAVGGIAGTYLKNAPLVARVRASVKTCGITLTRCAQEVIGGAPFCVSGACGLFRTWVLQEVGIPTRTNVEDLDLTWTLVQRGFLVRQSARAIVYAREAPTIQAEYRRWVRWITGYARCMHLHAPLLRTRFGLVIILGLLLGLTRLPVFVAFFAGLLHIGLNLEALRYLSVAFASLAVTGAVSAYRQGRRWTLLCYTPFSMLVTLTASAVWLTSGLWALVRGREVERDRPGRY